jgi:hypothetical protein
VELLLLEVGSRRVSSVVKEGEIGVSRGATNSLRRCDGHANDCEGKSMLARHCPKVE